MHSQACMVVASDRQRGPSDVFELHLGLGIKKGPSGPFCAISGRLTVFAYGKAVFEIVGGQFAFDIIHEDIRMRWIESRSIMVLFRFHLHVDLNAAAFRQEPDQKTGNRLQSHR